MSSSKKWGMLSAVCGLLAPPIMVALWAVASVLRSGYDQLTQKGSELGTGPNSIVMNLDFAIHGILITIFAVGLAREFYGNRWSKVGALLLLIAGIGETVVAGFPCDPGCPPSFGSLSQNAHLAIALVFFSSMTFAPLLVGIGIRRIESWKSYRSYSILSGIAGTLFGSAFAVAVFSLLPYVGLWERVFLAFPYLWIELMGIHMFTYLRKSIPVLRRDLFKAEVC